MLEANGTATTCGTSLALKSSSAQPSGAQLICTTSGTALVAGNNAPMWVLLSAMDTLPSRQIRKMQPGYLECFDSVMRNILLQIVIR